MAENHPLTTLDCQVFEGYTRCVAMVVPSTHQSTNQWHAMRSSGLQTSTGCPLGVTSQTVPSTVRRRTPEILQKCLEFAVGTSTSHHWNNRNCKDHGNKTTTPVYNSDFVQGSGSSQGNSYHGTNYSGTNVIVIINFTSISPDNN